MSKNLEEILAQINGTQIALKTDMDWVKKKLMEADSEEGYKRCVAHMAAIKTLKNDVCENKKTLKWIRNTVVGGLVAIIVVGCGAAANFMLGR